MRLGEQDLHFFRDGSHAGLYRHMGCQLGEDGASFRLWAPNAAAVSVIGDWNGWHPDARPLHPRADASGVWEGDDDRVRAGCVCKFRIVGPDSHEQDKADPDAFFAEEPPATASRAWRLAYEWRDAAWMAGRGGRNALRPTAVPGWSPATQHPGRACGHAAAVGPRSSRRISARISRA